MESTTGSKTTSRRRFALGAAWAVPAMAVSVAAPAYADSGRTVPTFTLATRCNGSNSKIRVTITPILTAISYTIQYSLDPTFAGGTTTSTGTSTQVDTVNLTNGTYYFRVRANYAGGGVSDYSASQQIVLNCPR